MNFDISTLCCNFLFYNNLIKFNLKIMQKKQDICKNMPPCHFLLIAIESSLKIQKRAECLEELASLTSNISLLGYSM